MYEEKRVLITGGAGFIGSNLARKLLELGANVLVVDNFKVGKYKNITEHDNRENFDWSKIDVRDPFALKHEVERFDPVEIFHLAANMGGVAFINALNADLLRDNLHMDLNVAELSLLNSVEKVFYSSSACVYPIHLQNKTNSRPLKEADAYPANPDASYGWEKLMGEKIFQSYNHDHGLEIRIARFHNCYGPKNSYDDLRGKVTGTLIRKAINWPGERFVVWGDGEQERSFIYIDDLLEGVLRLMQSNHSKPLNIGTDRMVKIKDLARIIIDTSGKPISIEYDPSKPQGVRSRNADLTLMKKVLKWEPEISLEEGVKKTYDWMVCDFGKV